MITWRRIVGAVALLWPMAVAAQSLPSLNMGYSGAGIGSDLLKVIERNNLWRKYGLDMKVVYLSRDRKSTRLNSSHIQKSRMPSSA